MLLQKSMTFVHGNCLHPSREGSILAQAIQPEIGFHECCLANISSLVRIAQSRASNCIDHILKADD